jgi:8-oxo-dGTP pyrophosphatase MutT (NUDIX family)
LPASATKREMKIKNKYRKGVFCVVYYGKKPLFLLLHRKLHWHGWEFCKGKMEKNETADETAVREVREETGQKPKNIKNLHVNGRYDYNRKFQKQVGFRGQTYILFIVKLQNKKIRIDKREHDSYKWADYKSALKMLPFKERRKCIKIVMHYLKKK